VTRAVRIANCSGFYGDRLSAPRELLAGPDPIDVLTGDYLAELTMLILWKAKQRDPSAGYATTFLRQMEEVLGSCLDRGVKVVTNAGGLDPRGLAARLHELAGRLGLAPRVAVVEGDDLMDRVDVLGLAAGDARPVTANAYLGGWGIAAALDAGTDIVVCPRVTDASLVVGPAASWHGWERDDWDALAGAVAVGHVIECGPQATGGNYPFLDELPDMRYPGFPIAEVAADGSAVITKQPGSGGVVSVGTITAQLLYEIAEPAYVNPDVVAHFDTIELAPDGPDRVRMSGARGGPAPAMLKVATNYEGGYRNTMTMVITGLDVDAKAARAETMLFDLLGVRDKFAEVVVQLLAGPDSTSHLRVTVKDPDPSKVGRRFANAVVELMLASYAGIFTTTPPTSETAFGIYRPAFVPATAVEHAVVLPDGTRVVIPPSPSASLSAGGSTTTTGRQRAEGWGATERRPLGNVCGARSGDKGGNANVGVWARTDEAYEWLAGHLTVERFRALVPEATALEVQRHELANLRALNFVVVGLLGDGVASTTRFDAQAKGLGEYLRSRLVDLPTALLR